MHGNASGYHDHGALLACRFGQSVVTSALFQDRPQTPPPSAPQEDFNVIVIDLCCAQQHRFEGWFASASAFESQLERKLVTCPICSSNDVRRLPSAPYVQTRTAMSPPAPVAATRAPAPPLGSEQAALLLASIRQLARQAEDVGERFPEEARRIHRGEVEARSIRGAASGDEMGELLDEGIIVLPVPPDEDLH
ncbi:MAG: DUF1178 family protein [Azoarcus sp.]|jgi:hypothetical protein|nr:DUF1178 family protein [Azoarcus sp.]